MKMIRHQRVCREDPVESINALAEEIEEVMAIAVVAKYLASLVAANGDVEKSARELES